MRSRPHPITLHAPNANGLPFSPRLASGDRSLQPLLEQHGFTGSKSQRRVIERLEALGLEKREFHDPTRRDWAKGYPFAQALARCPYRTLIGTGTDAEDMMSRVRCTIAVLGGDPEPLSPEMMTDALRVLNAGGVVLLISDDRAARDYAKREINALAGPAGGAA